jgi:hypothetical protein
MTEIEKVRQEIKVLEAKLSLLEEIEKHNAKPKMTFKDEGEFDIVSYNGYVYCRLKYPTDVIWYSKSMTGILEPIRDKKAKNKMETLYLQSRTYCPDDPEWYDEVEWDEKDNPNIQKIVDEMIEERKAQKLWNRLHDELGLTDSACLRIVDVVEDWMPKEQSAAGSQNVNTELLVEGFNDCVRQMKEMLS